MFRKFADLTPPLTIPGSNNGLSLLPYIYLLRQNEIIQDNRSVHSHARSFSLRPQGLEANHGNIWMNTKLSELPVDERIKLVEELWDSIAADQQALPLTEAQKAELNRRLDAYEVDRNPGRLASEAITDIRRKL